MDKATRKDNRKREFKRKMKWTSKNMIAAMLLSVRQTVGLPEVTALPWTASPIFIPKRSDVLKRRRMEAHNKRCKRKNTNHE